MIDIGVNLLENAPRLQRRTSSRPIMRVARPNPPYFPQAKISMQMKQM
ncbi:MAG: hypothetical protein JW750_11025 [Anaerolineaceae bacterium]|nr:hypothetical protein [Anaerolineaceae bacterium]